MAYEAILGTSPIDRIYGEPRAGLPAEANTRTDPAFPLSHCYHWLDSKAGYLKFKYDYARANQNELTFFTTPASSNGSVAGLVFYCAKSPSESHTYGDRLIRIDFVEDVVVLNDSTERRSADFAALTIRTIRTAKIKTGT